MRFELEQKVFHSTIYTHRCSFIVFGAHFSAVPAYKLTHKSLIRKKKNMKQNSSEKKCLNVRCEHAVRDSISAQRTTHIENRIVALVCRACYSNARNESGFQRGMNRREGYIHHHSISIRNTHETSTKKLGFHLHAHAHAQTHCTNNEIIIKDFCAAAVFRCFDRGSRCVT